MIKLKTVLLLLFCLCFCSTQVFAVKATSKIIKMSQPDGTTVLVRLHGDENGSYTTTTDGYLVTKDKDGYLKYAIVNKDNQLEVVNIIARNKDERDEDERKFLSSPKMQNPNKSNLLMGNTKKRIANNVKEHAILNYQTKNLTRAVNEEFNPRYLVLLVNFKDIKFTYTTDDFAAWLNEPGNTRYGATGSVKDYFIDNSDNSFSPDFDVVGPIELSFPAFVYGMNSFGSGSDMGAEQMIYEACLKAYEQFGVDLSKYDNTGNGIVDNINVIFAGYSEATTADPNLIWPHSYYLLDQPKFGETMVYNYTCSAEFSGDSGENMDGIGTFTHEFLHFLGLKDLYDTDSYANGLSLDPGEYSVMASGNYNNNSHTPPALMAYERFMLGWGSPIKILNDPEDIVLDDISTNSFYAINARPELTDPSTQGMEWFFIENRQRTGWNEYIPASGMMITHWDFTLDYGVDFWAYNAVNNYSKHRCLYIKCADNVDDVLSRNGDTYPGRSGNTEFTSSSFPAAIAWNGVGVNVPLTNIREENGKVLFQVSGGKSKISEIKTNIPTNVTDQSATLVASIVYAADAIQSSGFCLRSDGGVPTIDDNAIRVAAESNLMSYDISGLKAATHYRVRSFMELTNGDVVYGASLPFITECECKTAPYVDDFISWTDGFLDCWSIIDANKDATTWVYDKFSQAILYQYDYWNNANDWLISPKIRVPDNGHLFFTRAIMDVGTTEKLDIMISTKSREMNDFYVIERFNFADNNNMLVFEEVDLSAFVGQEIYIAFVCRSEKLQAALWLQNVYVTSKLDAPELIKFELGDKTLLGQKVDLEWLPVADAKKYYINIDMVVDTLVNETKFMGPDDFKDHSKTSVESGRIVFKENDTIETIDYPCGITNMMFIYTSSGPFGESSITIQGTEDGENWTQIGPSLKVKSTDQYECYLDNYLKDKNYTKIRFTCNYGGRQAIIQYLTLQYNLDRVETPYAGTSVGNTTKFNFDAKLLEDGYTYLGYIFASDGVLYYDASNKLAIDYNKATSIANVKDDKSLAIYTQNNRVTIIGLEADSKIDCIGLNGQIIKTVIATGEVTSFDADGYQGVMVLRITGNGKGYIYKILVK